MEKKLRVISHTHWDREWYMPFEQFKLKLVDLIDTCLKILQDDPEFIFHLDAQTVVLEDYLEIRPYRKDLIIKYVKEKRLVIGPWYLQNDFYLTSGESTIRNLLYGMQMCREFGDYCKVGYAPDQFGNISQLPQILRNFDIDNFVFGRGLTYYDEDNDGNLKQIPHPVEFKWVGPDGSFLTTVHMKTWYNNAQRFSKEIQKAKLLAESAVRGLEKYQISPYFLLMNGVDHLEPQDDLTEILTSLNIGVLEEGCEIKQIRLDDFISEISKYLKDQSIELPEVKGEIRYGADQELLKGTFSSRIDIKHINVFLQNEMENIIEPLFSMLELFGANGLYPADELDYAWKILLKNHPHDSICCCSKDEVINNMYDRYDRLEKILEFLKEKGKVFMTNHLEMSKNNQKDYIIAVANTTEISRKNEVIEVDIDITEYNKDFIIKIYDYENKDINFEIIEENEYLRDIFTTVNLPGVLRVKRYKILMEIDKIDPYSLRSFLVKLVKKENVKLTDNKICDNNFVAENNYLENNYYKVDVKSDGRINIFDKLANKYYQDILDIEETADSGDSYIYVKTDDSPIYYSEYPAEKISFVKNNYFQECKIEKNIKLPCGYDFDYKKRKSEFVDCKITVNIILKKNSPVLGLKYEIDNKAMDHRLRIVLKPGIITDYSYADTPFDIVKRDKDFHYKATMSRVLPNTSFALIQDDEIGFSVYTKGQHEFEHLEGKGLLAFTILRSTGVIGRDVNTLTSSGGEKWNSAGNQCIYKIQGELGFQFFSGNYIENHIPAAAKIFRTELVSCFNSCDHKRFTGGRTAVQDARVSELFYKDDPWENVVLKESTSAISFDNPNILISGFKKSISQKGLIIRSWNTTDMIQNSSLITNYPVYETQMNEEMDNISHKPVIDRYSYYPKKIFSAFIDLT